MYNYPYPIYFSLKVGCRIILILTSSTIDKKLEVIGPLSSFFFSNLESIFEFFVILSFLSMVDEVTITQHLGESLDGIAENFPKKKTAMG